MTDKGFLSRWSRRKRMVNAPVRSEAPVSEANEGRKDEGRKNESIPPSSKDVAESVEEFDLSTLPPLESISATTDVTAFLRKGVPPALSREALRRAWIADPTIRDFVGLAENAWDFNDPDAMPGFGPLDYTPEQLRDLVARIVGGVRSTTDDIADLAAPHPETEQVSSTQAVRHESPEAADVAAAATRRPDLEAEQGEPEDAAAQNPEAVLRERRKNGQRRADDPSVVRHTHGSALPR